MDNGELDLSDRNGLRALGFLIHRHSIPMHRFYLPPEQCQEPTLFLTGREAHHARHVLRIRRGERVTVLDGAGQEFLCEVQEYDRDKVRLAVVEKRFHPAPPCQVTLLQAVPKGKIIEAIIQKATELGASRIVPLLSERVVAQLDDAEAARKAAKWQLVAIEAIKQCGSAWLPRVEPPLTPEPIPRAEGELRAAADCFAAKRQPPGPGILPRLSSAARPHARVGLCLGRPRGRFHPGRNGGDQIPRRPAHHSRPAGPAHRNRGHLLPLHSQLRTAQPVFVLQLKCS